MSLIYMDGFDAGDQSARWTSVNGSPTRSLVTGRYGSGQALQLAATVTTLMGVSRYFTNAATIYFGGAFKISSAPTSGDVQIVHFGGFAAANVGLWLTTSLGITAWRHNSSQEMTQASGTALTSATEGLIANQWAYLEVMLTVADSGGRLVVKKNGNTILDFTGDTRTSANVTGTDHIILTGTNDPTRTATWDDVYVLNDSGSTNNNFQGDIEVKALLPDSNGNYSGFTGSDGNSVDNYQLVDDTNMSDYVEASVVGTKDSYGLQNLASVNVKGVQTVVQGNQAGGGSAAVRPFVRISGTDYPTTTQYLGQQTVTTHTLDVSPATSTTWGLAELNGTELGVEVV